MTTFGRDFFLPSRALAAWLPPASAKASAGKLDRPPKLQSSEEGLAVQLFSVALRLCVNPFAEALPSSPRKTEG
jgi:hypothetical protein